MENKDARIAWQGALFELFSENIWNRLSPMMDFYIKYFFNIKIDIILSNRIKYMIKFVNFLI